ncbi:MarR family transcriptional regulator [Labedella populi]|uniref:MarR family transcriptional regulator n=1 Tax=Labedella populi TaxID=2498850 RepID=A0A444Q6E5_9MICO|nr:MarR family transcriptional regulator [Labedella populi]RWZ59480.1 MarR family transcriptional regulator [Labedella populi]
MKTILRDYFSALVTHETVLWNTIDREIVARSGLSLGRLEFLRALSRRREARVQDLASDLGITVGAASKLVDRLVADGLVLRSPHPTDRRSSLIRLTADGETSVSASEAAFDAAIAEILPPESRADIENLTASLDALTRAVTSREAVGR